jgi:hypothetical protein
MATNPKIPNQNEPNRRGPTLVQKPERPSSAAPGVVLAIITALLLLGAIVYFMPRAPKGTTVAPAAANVPAQPVPGQLQISDVKLTPSPTGASLNLDGQITNTSGSLVNGIMAEVRFPLTNGQMASIERPVQGIAVGQLANKGKTTDTGKITGDTEDLTKAPIKAGETRPVRITVDRVPTNWNHEMPGIRLTTTTGTPQ